MQNEVGKTYKCLICGREIEVVKAGKGTIYCCGQPMVLKT
ncbi:MAG: desulfoferrodoxin [Candidatus Schekmanbacteria bacterium RBG_16_38_10]|uniref:Desulfoferrodoxin n=1 Tax=Candidatus Schekmanbacteria bacterium RBG_16_38_10 TaxID=1817879 RepID=A0A1F7RXC6_9BACT|nr:MAG: desulfoferrodoxin [Candidatus Schekmanbacteria bacterium RBG_16_38_10]